MRKKTKKSKNKLNRIKNGNATKIIIKMRDKSDKVIVVDTELGSRAMEKAMMGFKKERLSRRPEWPGLDCENAA